MKIDLNHFHYWMQAVRNSPNLTRTLDSFWQGQMQSKEWLIKNLRKNINSPVSIDILGGWNGVLASMLFQSNILIKHINSIDIDPDCYPIASMMNKGEEIVGKFNAITADMCEYQSTADVIINTSCEHITQDQYSQWLTKIPKTSLIVLQSNNYNIPEHIRISNSLDEFETQCNINAIWKGELKLQLYTRYMIIGKLF